MRLWHVLGCSYVVRVAVVPSPQLRADSYPRTVGISACVRGLSSMHTCVGGDRRRLNEVFHKVSVAGLTIVKYISSP